LFRIAHQGGGAAPGDFAPGLHGFDLLSEFCITDYWTANLANAMLQFGEEAKALHGLDAERNRFGLLEFVRCYDQAKQAQIIALFERSAYERRPFHFSADLRQADGGERIVHCFGAHRSVKDSGRGDELYGMFLFSRVLYESI
jgi:hypothetical protein